MHKHVSEERDAGSIAEYACRRLGWVRDTRCKNSNIRVVKQYVVFARSEGPDECSRVTSSI